MVRVSSKKIKDGVLKRISTLLVRQFARVRTSQESNAFFDEFFTETEQIMLAKRFAAVTMLERGYSYSTIMQTLEISPSTVWRMARKRREGGFRVTLAHCYPARGVGSRAGGDLLKAVETLLEISMPPIAGRGRWRGFHRAMDRAEARRESRHLGKRAQQRK